MQLRKSIAFLFLLVLRWSSLTVADEGVFADPSVTNFILGVLVDKGLGCFISTLEEFWLKRKFYVEQNVLFNQPPQ